MTISFSLDVAYLSLQPRRFGRGLRRQRDLQRPVEHVPALRALRLVRRERRVPTELALQVLRAHHIRFGEILHTRERVVLERVREGVRVVERVRLGEGVGREERACEQGALRRGFGYGHRAPGMPRQRRHGGGRPVIGFRLGRGRQYVGKERLTLSGRYEVFEHFLWRIFELLKEEFFVNVRFTAAGAEGV